MQSKRGDFGRLLSRQAGMLDDIYAILYGTLAPIHNVADSTIEQHVLEAIRGIRYGAVEVLIHDSRIVQVEKTEKIRFETTRNS